MKKHYPIVILTLLLTFVFGSSISFAKTAPTESDTVWVTMAHSFNMDATVTPQVQKQINRILRDRSRLVRILQKSEPYIYYIYQQTQTRQLPAELSLLPVVESEFSPTDFSSVGATGLWQLMPRTAKLLGVKIEKGYDGRRDVVASTNAALKFLKDLNKQFKGDWNLSLAAYNAGDGRVRHAIRHAGNKNFWKLGLPAETKAYVPKFLAIVEVVKHPSKYGITLPPISNQAAFTEMQSDKRLSLAEFAKQNNYDLSQLKKLNPDYNRRVVSKDGSYRYLVPITKTTQIA